MISKFIAIVSNTIDLGWRYPGGMDLVLLKNCIVL